MFYFNCLSRWLRSPWKSHLFTRWRVEDLSTINTRESFRFISPTECASGLILTLLLPGFCGLVLMSALWNWQQNHRDNINCKPWSQMNINISYYFVRCRNASFISRIGVQFKILNPRLETDQFEEWIMCDTMYVRKLSAKLAQISTFVLHVLSSVRSIVHISYRAISRSLDNSVSIILYNLYHNFTTSVLIWCSEKKANRTIFSYVIVNWPRPCHMCMSKVKLEPLWTYHQNSQRCFMKLCQTTWSHKI